MFNAGVRGKRAKDSTGLITVGEHFNQQTFLVPTVTRFAVTDGSYVDTNDTAADPAGNQVIVLYGSGFAPGATVLVGSTTIGAVTFLDSGRLTFSSPALGSGSYTVFVTNANGGTGILVPGLVYSGVPTFTTAAGSLGSVYETTAISTTVVATGDAPITYALSSGSLPTGSTLSSSGTISGTAPVDGSSTTYSFTVQTTDADNQDSVRSFSLTINTDVVSFSSPANNTTTSATQNTAISNVTVTATSAAGYGVLYTSSGLPTGLSMNTSTGIISGTPTINASNTSIITATANTTTRTASLYLNWTINLPGDLFWKYAALLMSANTVPNGNTFNTDLSTFNNEVIVVADTKPSEFHPFKEGYYSNYFDGTGDYLTTAATSTFANLWFGDVTVECWVYFNSVSSTPHIWSFSESSSVRVTLYIASSVFKLYTTVNGGSDIITSATTLTTGRWYHLAITKNSGTWTMWLNGASQGTSTSTNRPYGVNEMLAIGTQNYSPGAGDYLNGYISNLRAVSNTALYTTTFTPPTGPLTYVANTAVLTCQSNKLIDNSVNNTIITKNGDTTVNPFSPFNGTPTTITVPAANNYSMYFDGTGDYLSGPTNYPFIRTGPFTIEFWVYQPSLAAKTLIFNAHWDVGQNGGFRLNLSASGAVVFDASTGTYNTFPTVFTSTSTITASTWSHIAIVRNSSNSISCYINGVLARTPVTYASSLSLSSDGNIGQLRIGAGIYDSGAADLFNGYMSNIRIMNTDIYSGNFTPSNSPLALTQTSSANTAAITALPTNGNSVYFDGSGDYLQTPSSTFGLGTIFTVEAWIHPTVLTSGAIVFASTSSGEFSLGYNGTTRFGVSARGVSWLIDSATVPTLNSWNHIAVVRGGLGTNQTSLYINGTRVVNGTVSSAFTTLSTWQVGYDGGGGGSTWRGYISNVRVVAGTDVYGYTNTTITPPTSPLTAITDTKLLTCQSYSSSNNRVIFDNSTNAYTITSVGDTIAKTLSPFANTPAILMAQANTVIDNSNNGITFTVSGDARPARNGPFANTTTVTLIGNEGSAYFDGTGDYLEIAHAGNQWIGASTDFTIECWFNYTGTTGGERTLIGKGHQGSPAYAQFTLVLTSSNMLQFLASTSGGSWEINISDSVAVITNSWNHVAICRSGSTVTMYKNGAVVGTPATNSGALYNHTAPIRIGQHMSGSNYTGYISNARFVKGTALYTTPFVPSWAPLTPVANTVLLTAQTNLSSNTKVFVDESNLNSIVTGNGNATLGSFSPFGSTWSGYFDGSNDFLSIPTSSSFNFGTGDFTVECWVNWSSTTTNRGIISRYAGASSGWALRYDNTSGPTLNWINGDTSILIASHTPIAGTWYHYAVCRSGTTLRIFINGTQSASTTYSGNQDTSSTLYIGQLSNTLWPVNGYISNVRILKGTALYTAAFTPSTNPLLPVANTILLTCNSNRFVDYSAANNVITKGGDGASTVSKFSPFSSVTVTPASYSGYFDASGSTTTFPTIYTTSSTILNLYTANSTVECWFNLASYGSGANPTADRTLFSFYSGSAATYYAVKISSTGYLKIAKDGGGAASVTSTTFILTNNWYHFAWVHTANTTTNKFYINGADVTSTFSDASLSGAFPLNPASSTLYIGNTFYNNNPYTYIDPWCGAISNLRVVKDTAVYTSTFTPPTAPLTAIANTSLLTCQSTTFIDNSNNAFAITVNGDAKPVIQNPFTDTVSTATNYSANTFGNSVYFDGTTDYLTTPASTANQMTGDFTVECWIYPTSIPAQSGLVGINNTASSGGANFGFYLETNRNITFWVAGNATTYSSTNTPITIGVWQHVAFVRSGSTNTVYVNGVSVLTNSATPSWSGSPVITVGRLFGDNTGVTFYGYISNVRVIKGQALYTGPFVPSSQPSPVTSNTTLLLASTVGPSVTDALRISNIETFGTSRYVANNSPYYDTYSALFDGTGDYLAISTNSAFNIGTNSFTVEAWINTSSATQQTIFNISDTADSGYGAVRVQVLSGQTVQWLMGPGATWGVGVTAGSITLGTWNHIAITRNGSSVYFFINGLQVGTTQTYATSLTTGGTTYIGYNSGTAFGFNGYISNFRFINGNALYTANTTPSTSPLTAVANTSLLTCQSNKFIDNSNNAFTITKAGDAKITAVQPFAANNTSRLSSVYFATKTDYLAVRPQPSLVVFPGDFTFECWVYPTNTTLSTVWGIWDARNTGASAAAMTFSLGALASPVTGSWRLSYFNGTSYYGTGTVLWNQWTHVAWVRSGTTMTFYVNGVAGGTATISGTQTATATANPIYIGTKDNGLSNYGTIGYIADFRITNGYARTITVPTAPYDIK